MKWAWGAPLCGASALLLVSRAHGQVAQPCCLNPSPHVHGTLTEANRPLAGTELLADVPAAAPSPFQIVINPSASLQANPAALAAFNRAAAQWQQRVFDPITVNINATLAPLADNIIGSTSSVLLQGPYDLVAEVLVADALDEAADDTVVAALPSSVGFSSNTPAGTTFEGNVIATKANFKAMGFTGLDAPPFGAKDADITFSSNFAFDFDNSNGVSPGLTDFETVAAHEIGHVLGFISAVDFINAGDPDSSPAAWDLFRFPNNGADDPNSLLSFRTASRQLAPNGDHIFDDLDVEYRLSTGLIGSFFLGGDGYQASHFKADEFTGQFIGLMDPSLGRGVSYPVQESDLRILDLIGYEVQRIPEPSTLVLLPATLLFAARRRRFKAWCPSV